MLATHCDRDGCDTWQRVDTDIRDPAWLTVREQGTDQHFCSADCLLAHYGRRAPLSVVDL